MPTNVKVANNAFGELASSITDSDTTITLVTGNGARFPDISGDEYFYATLADTSNLLEIVKVTARNGDVFTVIRGQDNTIAKAYDAGDRIELRPVAALFEELADSANITYTPAGSNVVSTTVQAKLRKTVSVSDFGAVGDGVTDDRLAIQRALNTNRDVFFPEGDYYFSSQLFFQSDDQRIYGNGFKSIIRSNSGNVGITCSGKNNCGIYSIKFVGTGSAIGIVPTGNSKNFTVKDVYFLGGNHRVYLHNCEFVSVDGCIFENCAYQVIQRFNFVSNNCKVVNCRSNNCTADFVELNCEDKALSYNWLIANNIVSNVGSGSGTENRFVGATWCDNLVIANNIVNNVEGDAAIHLENPIKATITGNTFIDPHGSLARGIWFEPVPEIAGALNKGVLICTDNQFIVLSTVYGISNSSGSINIGDTVTSGNKTGKVKHFFGSNRIAISGADNFSGETNVSFSSGGTADLTSYESERIIGNSTERFFNAEIRNNVFEFWDDYPTQITQSDVGTKTRLLGIDTQFWFNGSGNISGNLFRHLDRGVRVSWNRAGDGNLIWNIDNNSFDLCKTGISNPEPSVAGKNRSINSIQGNTFLRCENVVFFGASEPIYFGKNAIESCVNFDAGNFCRPTWSVNTIRDTSFVNSVLDNLVIDHSAGNGEVIISLPNSSGYLNVSLRRLGNGRTLVFNLRGRFTNGADIELVDNFSYGFQVPGVTASIPASNQIKFSLSGGFLASNYRLRVGVQSLLNSV